MAAVIGIAILLGGVAYGRLEQSRSPRLIDQTTGGQMSVRQLRRHLSRWSRRHRELSQLLMMRGSSHVALPWDQIERCQVEAAEMKTDLEQAVQAVDRLSLSKAKIYSCAT